MKIQENQKPNIILLTKFYLILEIGEELSKDVINWFNVDTKLKQLLLLISDGKVTFEGIGILEVPYLIQPSISIISSFNHIHRDQELLKKSNFKISVLEKNFKYLSIAFNQIQNLIQSQLKERLFIYTIGCVGKLVLEDTIFDVSPEVINNSLRLIKMLLRSPNNLINTSVKTKLETGNLINCDFSLSVPVGDKIILSLVALCNKVLQNEKAIETLCNSLDILKRLIQVVYSDLLFVSFIPGTLSLVIKVLYRDPLKESSKVISNIFKLLELIIKRLQPKLKDYFNDDQNSAKDIGINSDWIKEFQNAMKLLINKLHHYTSHQTQLIRSTCLNFVFFLLADARSYIEKIDQLLLPHGISFIYDSSPQIQKMCAKYILDLSQQSFYKSKVLPLIYELFDKTFKDIVTKITTSTESEKQHTIKLLIAYVLIIGNDITAYFQNNILSNWMLLCKCLTARTSDITEFTSEENVENTLFNQFQIIKNNTSIDTLNNNLFMTFSINDYKYFNEYQTLYAFTEFLHYVGFYFGQIEAIIGQCFTVISSPSMIVYHPSSLYITSHFLYGKFKFANNPGAVLLHELHQNKGTIIYNEDILKPYYISLIQDLIEPEDFNLDKNYEVNDNEAISQLNEDYLVNKDKREIIKNIFDCHLIKLIGFTSQIFGESFKLELFNLLYFLLEKLGNPNYQVSTTANQCLSVVRIACGYSDMASMFHENMDYLLHCSSLYLHPTRLHFPVTHMLSALLKYNQSMDLYLLDDILTQVIDGLFYTSNSGVGTEMNKMTNGLLNILESMALIYSRQRYDRELALIQDNLKKNEFIRNLNITNQENENNKCNVSREVMEFIEMYKEDKREQKILNDSIDSLHENLTALDFSSKSIEDDKATEVDTYEEPESILSNDPVLTRCIEQLQKIIKLCSHYITFSDVNNRLVVLRILYNITSQQESNIDVSSNEALYSCRASFDNSWHIIWPFLKECLSDQNTGVLSLSLKIMIQLVKFNEDFLASRMITDILPKVFTLLHHNIIKESVESKGINLQLEVIDLSTITYSDNNNCEETSLMHQIAISENELISKDSSQKHLCLLFIKSLIKLNKQSVHYIWNRFNYIKELIEYGIFEAKVSKYPIIIKFIKTNLLNILLIKPYSNADKDLYWLIKCIIDNL